MNIHTRTNDSLGFSTSTPTTIGDGVNTHVCYEFSSFMANETYFILQSSLQRTALHAQTIAQRLPHAADAPGRPAC